jgi:sialic acid synthase SpsE
MNTEVVKIGDRLIGPGQPCYLIAEVGTTCLGQMDKAKALIRAAANAGVDAVKFQVIDPTQISDSSVTYNVMAGSSVKSVNMKSMFESLVFREEDWMEIANECEKASIQFFATVDHIAGVDLLERIDVPIHKMGAWDATYRPLIEHIARTGKPMFFDLGPATQEEFNDVVNWFRAAGGQSILFMHDFHTAVDAEMNMRAIRFLTSSLPWPAGFSSPARDDDLDVLALALGAYHIEKRLILSRSEPAFHAHESLEPQELAAWVKRIRRLEQTLGSEIIRPSARDREQSRDYYRSICTLRPVAKGEVFSVENLGGKRPGTGLPTTRLFEIWGSKATRALDVDTLISEADIA